jgi:hypothetical protein
VRFFIDNCLPHRVATALQALEAGGPNEVKHLRDLYKPDTPDVEWMEKLAADGRWTIVTRDQMYKVVKEKEAIHKAGNVIFFLSKGWAHLELWEQASKLFHWWPRLAEDAGRARRGDCFLVPPKGNKLDRLRV